MIIKSTLAMLLFGSPAPSFAADVYLGTVKASVLSVSTVDSTPAFTPRRFVDVSEADQRKIQAENAYEFFTKHSAAKAWLVPPPRLQIRVLDRGPEWLQKTYGGRTTGGLSKMVRNVRFSAGVMTNFVFPSNHQGNFNLRDAIRITPGELIIYSDDAQLTSIGKVDPSVLLEQIQILRPELASPRIWLGPELRYRLGRLISAKVASSATTFDLAFRFTAAGQPVLHEIPIFAWTGEAGVEEFRNLFHLNTSRFLNGPYLAQRCADLLKFSRTSRLALR